MSLWWSRSIWIPFQVQENIDRDRNAKINSYQTSWGVVTYPVLRNWFLCNQMDTDRHSHFQCLAQSKSLHSDKDLMNMVLYKTEWQKAKLVNERHHEKYTYKAYLFCKRKTFIWCFDSSGLFEVFYPCVSGPYCYFFWNKLWSVFYLQVKRSYTKYSMD